MADHRDCAVFLTHVWNEAIRHHYERLQREAGEVLDVFLVLQSSGGGVPEGMMPDLVVDIDQSAQHFPTRYQEYRSVERGSPWGYVDLVWCTAFLDPLLAGYDRLWLIEYDVDYSGNWSDFFSVAREYDADLLAAHVRTVREEPDFIYVPGLRKPADVAIEPLIVFMPLSRLSRRLLDHYRDVLRESGWAGHFELVLPTIAAARGLTVADLGGEGSFTPLERRGLHYVGDFTSLQKNDTTHAWRPARTNRYFVDAPADFLEPGRIYHPVKTNARFWARLQVDKRILFERLRRWAQR